MRELTEVILHETESTTVDFKAKQYSKDQHRELLKDVIAMANANADGERLIVCGVKLRPGQERELLGIENPVDAGNYHQLVAANIEPTLAVDYVTEEVDGKLFGIFRIRDQSLNRPFLMKKDYPGMFKGWGFIRRGTTTEHLLRKDYDLIYKEKQKDDRLDEEIVLSFSPQEQHGMLVVPTADLHDLPSREAEAEIRGILQQRASSPMAQPFIGMRGLSNALGHPVSYEHKTDDELREELASIKKTYHQSDQHHAFERRGQQVQVYLFNTSSRFYLEDATVKLQIPHVDGVYVADEFPREPRSILQFDPLEGRGYPDVSANLSGIIVSTEVGNVRHGLPEAIFEEALRIVATEEAAGKEFSITAEIFGKNVVNPPLRRELKVKVAGAMTAQDE